MAAPRTQAARKWIAIAPALAIAAGLCWLAVTVNVQRGCAVMDTPYLPLCPALSADVQQQIAQLKARAAASPGDTAAYVQLAHIDRSPGRPALVAAASRVAPRHPQVRMAEAMVALEAQDWRRSVAALVGVVEHHTVPAPAQALARMIGAGQADLLAEYITPGSRWFYRVMDQMDGAGVPLSAALPLIEKAYRQRVIDLQGARPYLRRLKAEGNWGDAYALWLALRGSPAALLLNASFDQALEADGFDWESAALSTPRPAVAIAQPAVPRRGVVLEMAFNGRPLPLPILRQHVFLGEGSYRLSGQYRTVQLRTEDGVAWRVQCTRSSSAPSRAGTALKETAGAWQSFDALFDVPAGCGTVVSLQLDTASPAEARAGIRGKLYFDEFRLELVSRPAYASNRITPVGTSAPSR